MSETNAADVTAETGIVPDFDSIDECPVCNWARGISGHTCSRCGRWHGATPDFSMKYKVVENLPFRKQYVERTCPRCGYRWHEKPAHLPVSMEKQLC